MSISGGDAELQRMIGRLRALGGDGLVHAAAAQAAPLVEAASKATAAAGTTPDGAAWAPRKRDGGRAMANAAKAVTATAVGALVTIRLTGVEVFHHFSKATPRKVIPEGGGSTGLPAGLAAACLAGARAAFLKLTGAAA